MTVQEMMDLLSQLNPEQEIMMNWGGFYTSISGIGEVKLESGIYITINW